MLAAAFVALPLLATGLAAQASDSVCAPAKAPMSHGDAADRTGIQDLLDTYTQSVSTGDSARFESQLLDTRIPFFGIGGALERSFKPELRSVQDYAGFRRAVFGSGRKFTQKFYDVVMDQDGDLAQVSLKFKTLQQGSDGGGCGWKVLHLLKVGGHWKIASEFYTAYAFEASDW